MPDYYTRKQTLTNAERYITPELKEMEDMILGAEDKLVQLEYELFREPREQIAKKCGPYPENSKGIGKDRCVCLLGTDFRTEPLLPSVIKPEWQDRY